jgi:hypothetical protein
MHVMAQLMVKASVLVSMGAQDSTSGLRFAPPVGWERSVDASTKFTSITPPGGGASVTFTASAEFAGTAEEWQNELWNGLLGTMQPATQAVPGTQGKFLTRMAVFMRPDGSRPWICLYSLVKDRRGEAALFIAEDNAHFFTHLGTVNQMMHGIAMADAPEGRGATPGAPVNAPGPAPSVPGPAAGAGPLPVLEYKMSPDFPGRQGAGTYVSAHVDGTIQVYDFRAFSGNFEADFRKTLLRDWIAPSNREERVLGTPVVQASRMAGAEQVFTARFRQDYWGIARERYRVAILAAGRVAIVDINVRDADAWQRYQRGIMAFLESLKVGAPAPTSVASPVGVEGGTVAGLYLANKQQFQPNVLGPVGSGSWQMGTEYYLLSSTGRLHRGRKLPKAPDGDIRRFDYDAAQREDPANSGTYMERGNQVIMRLGEAPYETITANRLGPDALEIYDVGFKRAVGDPATPPAGPPARPQTPPSPPAAPPATAAPAAPPSPAGDVRLGGAFLAAAAPGKRPAMILFGRDGRFAFEGLRDIVAGAAADPAFPSRAKGTYQIRDGKLLLRLENATLPPIAIVLEGGDPENPPRILLNGTALEREKRPVPAKKSEGQPQ